MAEPKERHVEISSRETPMAYGTKADLLGARPLKTRDVEVLGKKYRVRELKLRESDEIQHRTIRNELNDKGSVTGHADLRGTMALRVACGLIHQDGTPYFPKPFDEYEQLLDLPGDVLAPLDKTILELSAQTAEAKDALGKDSGGTDTGAG